MKFTPGQVQETLQLTQGTFRQWKCVFPSLSGRNGYSPCFTLGDLLAMAVIRNLTQKVGVKVNDLRGIADALFDACGETSWTALERMILIVDPINSRISFIAENQVPTFSEIIIIYPLRSTIRALQDHLLLGHQISQQEPLRFPPTSLSGNVRRRGTS